MTRLPVVLVVVLLTAGCSGDDGDPAGPSPATATPTSVGDRQRVEVLDPGAEPRRSLRYTAGAVGGALLTIDQEVTADRQVTDPPPVAIAFDAEASGRDSRLTLATSYTAVEVEDPGLRRSLAPLVGAGDEVSLRADGTSDAVEAAATPELELVRSQLLTLLPVLPTDDVGVGASWSATSVVSVDGATVDQVATYRLESLDGDAYVIGVEMSQQYRVGAVEDVEVTAGRGTVSGRFEGDLGQLLPSSADADVTTQVAYDLGDTITEVTTTVSLGLTAGSTG